MNCANHPENPATAFCRECGKPLCAECQHAALGSIFCAQHVPAAAPSGSRPAAPTWQSPPEPGSPYTAPPVTPPASPGLAAQPPVPGANPSASPVIAFLLGFIPGVGAIYNGQYAKGLIHAVVFGILVSIVNRVSGPMEPLVGIMIAAWVFYMAFEAYHTARKRRFGVAVEEFSSLFDNRPAEARFPVGGIALVGLGFILLLDTTGILGMDIIERYWPIGLILLGMYMLYVRLHSPAEHESRNNAEVRR